MKYVKEMCEHASQPNRKEPIKCAVRNDYCCVMGRCTDGNIYHLDGYKNCMRLKRKVLYGVVEQPEPLAEFSAEPQEAPVKPKRCNHKYEYDISTLTMVEPFVVKGVCIKCGNEKEITYAEYKRRFMKEETQNDN